MSAPRGRMLHLRMDPELHDALAEYAKRNRRSMTNSLEFILADVLCGDEHECDHDESHRQYA